MKKVRIIVSVVVQQAGKEQIYLDTSSQFDVVDYDKLPVEVLQDDFDQIMEQLPRLLKEHPNG